LKFSLIAPCFMGVLSPPATVVLSPCFMGLPPFDGGGAVCWYWSSVRKYSFKHPDLRSTLIALHCSNSRITLVTVSSFLIPQYFWNCVTAMVLELRPNP